MKFGHQLAEIQESLRGLFSHSHWVNYKGLKKKLKEDDLTEAEYFTLWEEQLQTVAQVLHDPPASVDAETLGFYMHTNKEALRKSVKKYVKKMNDKYELKSSPPFPEDELKGGTTLGRAGVKDHDETRGLLYDARLRQTEHVLFEAMMREQLNELLEDKSSLLQLAVTEKELNPDLASHSSSLSAGLSRLPLSVSAERLSPEQITVNRGPGMSGPERTVIGAVSLLDNAMEGNSESDDKIPEACPEKLCSSLRGDQGFKRDSFKKGSLKETSIEMEARSSRNGEARSSNVEVESEQILLYLKRKENERAEQEVLEICEKVMRDEQEAGSGLKARVSSKIKRTKNHLPNRIVFCCDTFSPLTIFTFVVAIQPVFIEIVNEAGRQAQNEAQAQNQSSAEYATRTQAQKNMEETAGRILISASILFAEAIISFLVGTLSAYIVNPNGTPNDLKSKNPFSNLGGIIQRLCGWPLFPFFWNWGGRLNPTNRIGNSPKEDALVVFRKETLCQAAIAGSLRYLEEFLSLLLILLFMDPITYMVLSQTRLVVTAFISQYLAKKVKQKKNARRRQILIDHLQKHDQNSEKRDHAKEETYQSGDSSAVEDVGRYDSDGGLQEGGRYDYHTRKYDSQSTDDETAVNTAVNTPKAAGNTPQAGAASPKGRDSPNGVQTPKGVRPHKAGVSGFSKKSRGSSETSKTNSRVSTPTNGSGRSRTGSVDSVALSSSLNLGASSRVLRKQLAEVDLEIKGKTKGPNRIQWHGLLIILVSMLTFYVSHAGVPFQDEKSSNPMQTLTGLIVLFVAVFLKGIASTYLEFLVKQKMEDSLLTQCGQVGLGTIPITIPFLIGGYIYYGGVTATSTTTTPTTVSPDVPVGAPGAVANGSPPSSAANGSPSSLLRLLAGTTSSDTSTLGAAELPTDSSAHSVHPLELWSTSALPLGLSAFIVCKNWFSAYLVKRHSAVAKYVIYAVAVTMTYFFQLLILKSNEQSFKPLSFLSSISVMQGALLFADGMRIPKFKTL